MQIPSALWMEYIKAVFMKLCLCEGFEIPENQDAARTCRCGVGLKRKPTARWAKLLAGRKGQKLVFHFLNNRHNHGTVTLM